jgi:site-specific DNA recombinase
MLSGKHGAAQHGTACLRSLRVSDRYVSSLLPLAFLAPDIVDAIAAGQQPPELTAHRLIRTVHLPIAWAAQRQLLGIS